MGPGYTVVWVMACTHDSLAESQNELVKTRQFAPKENISQQWQNAIALPRYSFYYLYIRLLEFSPKYLRYKKAENIDSLLNEYFEQST